MNYSSEAISSTNHTILIINLADAFILRNVMSINIHTYYTLPNINKQTKCVHGHGLVPVRGASSAVSLKL